MKLGEIKYVYHSNKPKCVFVDSKELPLVCIDIWCKAGASFENSGKDGTAHFLEHMIFKGNDKISPGEFDNKIESLGGMSNASTGYDDVHYYVQVPPNNFKESLALLTNIVLTPSFKEIEFYKEKSVVIDEIKQQNDQPDEKLFNYFLSRVWGNNTYGKPILGTEKNIQSLNIEDLEKFHKSHYKNSNLCIAIAGNLSSQIYEDFQEIKFPFTNNSELNKNINKKFPEVTRTGREEIDFENIEFSRIFMAWRIPSLKNQRLIIGFEILSSILSFGRNSRFVKILKEDRNLAQSIFVDVNGGELGSLLIIEACCDKKNLNILESEINNIINQISNRNNITQRELEKALNIVKSNYIFNLETSNQLTSFYGNELLWGRKNSIKDLDIHLSHWKNIDNFKEITNYLSKDKYTLIASPIND